MINSILNGLKVGHLQNTPDIKADPPKFCGDIDMRITRDGIWHYCGSPIDRQTMVKLFASVLKRDEDGEFWLETPIEKCRIQVDDVPFIAVDMSVSGAGNGQIIKFRTNLDEIVIAGPDNPIRMSHEKFANGPTPYVLVRDCLDALISRAVYYDLVEIAVKVVAANKTVLGVWSGGEFFELGRCDEV